MGASLNRVAWPLREEFHKVEPKMIPA